MDPFGAVVMAAGAGRRMGVRPKSLLLRGDEPLLLRQIRLLSLAGASAVVVVLGHHQEALRAVLQPTQSRFPQLRWAVNPAPDDGPASSLCHGLAALPPSLQAIVVTLGDQPLLEADDFRAVLQAWHARASGIDLVVPTHQGQPGHPLVFGAAVRQAVQRASGAAGVPEWRRAHPDRVQALAQAHARCTTDIDTEEDLARLAAQHGVALTWPQPQARS
ncbi:MAG: nucleotidyltransferase family protein [Burkholderiaceae bacterium]